MKHVEESGGPAATVERTTPSTCPGSAPRAIERCELVDRSGEPGEPTDVPSRLTNWPVQLMLVPPKAPYFDGSHLLIAADCVPFAFAGFHERFVVGQDAYHRLPQARQRRDVQEEARSRYSSRTISSRSTWPTWRCRAASGSCTWSTNRSKESEKNIPLRLVKVGIEGDILDTIDVEPGGGE